jgi:uncharacterized protein
VRKHVELVLPDGRTFCRARVARSFFARLRGLLGAAGLEPGTGVLFPRTRSVHTHFMRFPIDVVFLDRDSRVVRIVPALPAWRMVSERRGDAVLELPPGECARVGLHEGDVLEER